MPPDALVPNANSTVTLIKATLDDIQLGNVKLDEADFGEQCDPGRKSRVLR